MIQSRMISSQIYQKLLHHVPGGANSPMRSFKGLDICPMIVDRGVQDCIEDVDGNRYIDFNLAWGSLILGHTHPKVVKSTTDQVLKGSSFGITTALELQFATVFKSCVPSVEKLRVVASGTEATMTAMRLARGYTQREIVLKFNGHYHGHSDTFLVKAGSGVSQMCQGASSQGIPVAVTQSCFSLPFNDEQALEACFEQYGSLIAAVILEPVAGNMGVVLPNPNFLRRLRELTEQYGAVLIFDEVITGFRLSLAGAQGLYGITPDLSTYSKIIGGGYPVGVVGGRQKIMDLLAPLGPVYQAGTLSGNPVALAGACTVLEELKQPNFYARLQDKVDFFLKPIEDYLQDYPMPVCINRCGPMFSFFFGITQAQSYEQVQKANPEIFKKFFLFLFHQGIYISPSYIEASFISAAHTYEHLKIAQTKILECLESLLPSCAGSITNDYANSKI
jgi:glutamate-1-semialdehyde 2,1-aminomutase